LEICHTEGRPWEETEEEMWEDRQVERLCFQITNLKWKHLRRKRKKNWNNCIVTN
jgi:hypothetical protein